MSKLLSATLLLGLQISALVLDLVVAGGGDTYWSYDDGKTVKSFRGKLLPIASLFFNEKCQGLEKMKVRRSKRVCSAKSRDSYSRCFEFPPKFAYLLKLFFLVCHVFYCNCMSQNFSCHFKAMMSLLHQQTDVFCYLYSSLVLG